MESLVDKNLFSGVYKGLPVLVTGHTGFKGSWLIQWLKEMGAEVTGYARAPNTTPNHFDLINPDIDSVVGELRDLGTLKSTIERCQPKIIFHLAAQALVLPSYEDPVDTFESNVMGTLNVLEATRLNKNVEAVVCVTTDKVYYNDESGKAYVEEDILGGLDPYSGSKSSAEMLIQSYQHSFFNLKKYKVDHNTLLAVARAGNVIGGGDWSENRLIPDLVKASLENKSTTIRSPQSVRPWQHVLESLSGYLLLGKKLLSGDVKFCGKWNFGPNEEDHLSVGEVVRNFKAQWPKIEFNFDESAAKVHEAKVLKLNCNKAKDQLNWQPIWGLSEAVASTAQWYMSFYERDNISTVSNIEEYVLQAKEKQVEWIKE